MNSYLFIVVGCLSIVALVQCQLENVYKVDGIYERTSKDRHPPQPVLECGLKTESSLEVKFYWSSNGRHSSDDSVHYVIKEITESDHPPKSVLNFTKIGEKDVGDWLCTVAFGDERNVSVTVSLFSLPQIKPLPKSVNLVEGETVNLECHVWGWPLPRVSWRRGSQPLNATDPRVSFPNDTDVPNMKLKIVKTTPEDRDDYLCVATSVVNGTEHEETASTLVRVKSHLAPLWPFLGILAEVILLAVIIISYELYRRKQKGDTDDKDASQNQHSAISDEKNKDLRRRK